MAGPLLRHPRVSIALQRRCGGPQRPTRQVRSRWLQPVYSGDPAVSGYRRSADLRVTRAGRYLRSADIDELPQLLNVLRGEMSLVGPRPGIPYELQYYEPGYYERLRVKPGITGPWQVSGRDRRTAAEMIAMDLDYVVNRSAWNDLKILARTIPVVLADMAAVLR